MAGLARGTSAQPYRESYVSSYIIQWLLCGYSYSYVQCTYVYVLCVMYYNSTICVDPSVICVSSFAPRTLLHDSRLYKYKIPISYSRYSSYCTHGSLHRYYTCSIDVTSLE